MLTLDEGTQKKKVWESKKREEITGISIIQLIASFPTK